jgi:hypothetical protein
MYVTRDKSEAVVFAFSTNSDHWNNLVPRLPLQGLLPDVEYELTEPTPNDIKRAAGNYMMIESDGKSLLDINFFNSCYLSYSSCLSTWSWFSGSHRRNLNEWWFTNQILYFRRCCCFLLKKSKLETLEDIA